VASDEVENEKFAKFIKWLRDGGADTKKLKLIYYEENHRGVHAAKNI